MPFETRPDKAIAGEHGIDDLKIVYRVLHRYLAKHPELMDTDFLHELQTVLQSVAKGEGVDVSHHGEWDRWLGNVESESCEDRVARRHVIEPSRKS